MYCIKRLYHFLSNRVFQPDWELKDCPLICIFRKSVFGTLILRNGALRTYVSFGKISLLSIVIPQAESIPEHCKQYIVNMSNMLHVRTALISNLK